MIINDEFKKKMLNFKFKKLNKNVYPLFFKGEIPLKSISQMSPEEKKNYRNHPVKELRIELEKMNYKQSIKDIQNKFDAEYEIARKELKALIQIQKELKESPEFFIKKDIYNQEVKVIDPLANELKKEIKRFHRIIENKENDINLKDNEKGR